MKNVISVEPAGVSEPLDLWRVTDGRVYRLSQDELNAHSQSVSEWERRDREALFDSDKVDS
jgi:hypothetical protein